MGSPLRFPLSCPIFHIWKQWAAYWAAHWAAHCFHNYMEVVDILICMANSHGQPTGSPLRCPRAAHGQRNGQLPCFFRIIYSYSTLNTYTYNVSMDINHYILYRYISIQIYGQPTSCCGIISKHMNPFELPKIFQNFTPLLHHSSAFSPLNLFFTSLKSGGARPPCPRFLWPCMCRANAISRMLYVNSLQLRIELTHAYPIEVVSQTRRYSRKVQKNKSYIIFSNNL